MAEPSGFVATVRAEVGALDASPRALARFGWVVGGVFTLVGGGLAWRAGGVGPLTGALLAVGGALVAGGTLAPRALAVPFRAWMTLAMALGFVMTRVILTLAFGLVFVPVSLVFRLIGRDPLHRRPDASAASYWVARSDGPSARERLERMW